MSRRWLAFLVAAAGCAHRPHVATPVAPSTSTPAVDAKLDQYLRQVVAAQRSKGAPGIKDLADKNVVSLVNGMLEVDVTAEDDAAAAALKEKLPALRAVLVTELANHIWIRIPPESVEKLAAMAQVHFLSVPQTVFKPAATR